jgi:hypothetical protein
MHSLLLSCMSPNKYTYMLSDLRYAARKEHTPDKNSPISLGSAGFIRGGAHSPPNESSSCHFFVCFWIRLDFDECNYVEQAAKARGRRGTP